MKCHNRMEPYGCRGPLEFGPASHGFGPGHHGFPPGHGFGLGPPAFGPRHHGFGPGHHGFGPGHHGFGPGHHGFGPGHHDFGPGRHGFGPGHHGFGWGPRKPHCLGTEHDFGPRRCRGNRLGGRRHRGHHEFHGRFGTAHPFTFNNYFECEGDCENNGHIEREELISIIEALAFRTPPKSSPQPTASPAQAEPTASTSAQGQGN